MKTLFSLEIPILSVRVGLVTYMAENLTLLNSGRPSPTVLKKAKTSFLLKIPFLRIRVGQVNRVGASAWSTKKKFA